MTTRSDEKPPHPIDIHIGHRIKHRRKSIDLSQKALSSALNIPITEMKEYENGHRPLEPRHLYELGVILGVDQNYFHQNVEKWAAFSLRRERWQYDLPDHLTQAVPPIYSLADDLEKESLRLAERWQHLPTDLARKRVTELISYLQKSPKL